MAGLVFWDRLVTGGTDAAVAILGKVSGGPRTGVVGVDDMAGRATTRAVVARNLVRSQGPQRGGVEPCLKNVREHGRDASVSARSSGSQGRIVDFSDSQWVLDGRDLKLGMGHQLVQRPVSTSRAGRPRRVYKLRRPAIAVEGFSEQSNFAFDGAVVVEAGA